MVEGLLPSDLVAKYEAPRFSRRISIGNFQYLATAANAFDHAIKRRVLAIELDHLDHPSGSSEGT
jgi:hypothetical protein